MILLQLGRDSLLLAALLAAAWGVARPARRLLAAIPAEADRSLARLGIGLAVISTCLFVIGIAGGLTRATIAGVGVVGWAGCWPDIRSWFAGRGCTTGVRRPVPGVSELVLIGLLMLSGAIALAGALVPEWFYDALHYHLALPDAFLRAGRVAVFPAVVHSAMPMAGHMLFLPLLAWGDASTVRVLHLAALAGCCTWIWSLARRDGGSIGGLAAALLFAAVPGVGIVSGVASVDLVVTFFAVGGLVLLLRDGRLAGGDVLLAGVLLGFAAAAKYSALAALAVGMALAFCRGGAPGRSLRSRAGTAAALGLAAFAAAAPWYLRSWVALGNPLYPAMSPPGSYGARVAANLLSDSPAPYPWSQVGRLFVDLVAERGAFAAGSETYPLGMVLAIGTALALLHRGSRRRTALIVLVLFLAWSRSILVLRYAYPMVALAAAATGAAVFATARRSLRAIAVACLAVAVGLGLFREVLLQRSLYGGPWAFATGIEDGAGFLARVVPGARAAAWVVAHTDPAATRLLLVGETRAFWYRRAFVPVDAYDRNPLAPLVDQARDSNELRDRVIALGVTHLVVDPAEMQRLDRRYGHLALDPRGHQLLARFLGDLPVAYAADGVTVLTVGAAGPRDVAR